MTPQPKLQTLLFVAVIVAEETELAAAGGHVVVCELLLDALADVHKCLGPPFFMSKREAATAVFRQVDGITALSLARKAASGIKALEQGIKLGI